MVPEAELVRRLGTRMICEDCGDERATGTAHRSRGALRAGAAARLVQRADDNEAVVLERLKVYHRQTEPLVEYYRARPTFRSIDGAQAPDRVAADLAAAIEAAARRRAAGAHAR